MCDYCEMKDRGITVCDSGKIILHYSQSLIAKFSDGKFYLWDSDGSKKEIYFCPICGRKLWP